MYTNTKVTQSAYISFTKIICDNTAQLKLNYPFYARLSNIRLKVNMFVPRVMKANFNIIMLNLVAYFKH